MELNDHRGGGKIPPKVKRITLKPTSESIHSDLAAINEQYGGRLSMENIHEIEAKILVYSTLVHLCLC